MILQIIIVLFCSYLLLFLLSIILKDNSIVDIFWGIGFLEIAILSYYYSDFEKLSQMILLGLISLWSFRISGHILRKKLNKKIEDSRYQVWRKEWDYFYLRCFFQIYVLQGILLFIVAIPIIVFNLKPTNLNWLIVLGIIVSLIGLIFETIADLQLTKFLSHTENKGKLMTSGLWEHTRHPNYFGESIFWLGISLIGLSTSYLAIIGWVVITYLLRFVSGVPMAEKNYLDREDFQEYAKVTPAFVPNFFIK